MPDVSPVTPEPGSRSRVFDAIYRIPEPSAAAGAPAPLVGAPPEERAPGANLEGLARWMVKAADRKRLAVHRKVASSLMKRLERFRIAGPLTRDLRALVYGWCYLIAFMAVLLALTSLFVLGALLFGTSASSMVPLIAASLGLVGLFVAVANVILGRILETSNRRLGTVDLFISEISSICSVIIAMRLLPHFQGLAMADDKTLVELDARNVFYAAEENYLHIFEKHYAELGSLSDPVPIRRVTAFYSYLKGSRDAFRALQLWRGGSPIEGEVQRTPAEAKRRQATQVWLLLHLCLARGAESLAELIEGNTGTNGQRETRATAEEVLATLGWILEVLEESVAPLRGALLKHNIPLPAADSDGPSALRMQLRPAVADALIRKVAARGDLPSPEEVPPLTP